MGGGVSYSETYIVACLWLPELDVFGGQSLDVTGLVDNTGSSRTCAYIHANVVVLYWKRG
jgi:hypothetical protein